MNKPVEATQMSAVGNKQKKAYSLSAFRILVVEDYPFMADLISTMLREFGVGNIVQASSGNEAREMIMLFNSDETSRNKIDLVLLDWLMPDGDGLELLKWLRGHKKDSIRFLPSVLCSAYASEDVVVAGRDNGANEVLVKPVSAQKLASRLLYVIDKPRPFLKVPGFFGPDRRRRIEEYKGTERRITKAEDIKSYHERL
jgi:two-component system chemotaxis response regulator CheY